MLTTWPLQRPNILWTCYFYWRNRSLLNLLPTLNVIFVGWNYPYPIALAEIRIPSIQFEHLSSGYGKRLLFKRWWVRITAPDFEYTFFTKFICKNCIVGLKRLKINEKEASDGARKNIQFDFLKIWTIPGLFFFILVFSIHSWQ